jgi:prepilin-type N-terminal cleavage/methylation domain-containing protein
MKTTPHNTGFTLIELLISIGIFAVFLVIVSGVFGRFVEVQRHSIEQGALILEVQTVMEAFVKEARTGFGSEYFQSASGHEISFRNQSGDCVSYRLGSRRENGVDRGVVERAEIPEDAISDCRFDDPEFDNATFVPLSSSGLDVTDLYFESIRSTTVGGGGSITLEKQGVVTIVITAKSKKGTIPALTVQNTVTSRQVKPYEN